MTLEGNPWFVLGDVARVLGLQEHVRGGFRDHIRHLADDESRVLRKAHYPNLWVLFPGTASSAKLISEAGLYKLIMRSDKPVAKPFQDWVTREVLPSIRKTGGYRLEAGAALHSIVSQIAGGGGPQRYEALDSRCRCSYCVLASRESLNGPCRPPRLPCRCRR